ncbi:hypothetical protein BDZ45DRAFT_608320, partial [Acephala macrosclerotiorum]
RKFKFILQNDYKFNYSIIIDVLYLNKKLVLQIINSFTIFQIIKFIKNIFAKII